MRILVRRDPGGWLVVVREEWKVAPEAFVIELSEQAAVAYCQMSVYERRTFLDNYIALLESTRAVEEREAANKKALREEWLREHPDNLF